LAQASDKNIYATAYTAGGYNGYSGFAVIKETPAASTLQKFALPSGAGTVNGWLGLIGTLPIAGGPDARVWVGEPGLNEIAAMTTTGIFSQFKIPTAASGISSITAVPGTVDATGALWFTEGSSNKIARISVSGSVMEIPVPTASARPSGIIPCPTTVCGAHGGVWFAEPGVNRIARYDFP
jgi:streptogramin lyase